MKNFSAKNAEFETLKINNEAAIGTTGTDFKLDVLSDEYKTAKFARSGGTPHLFFENTDDVAADGVQTDCAIFIASNLEFRLSRRAGDNIAQDQNVWLAGDSAGNVGIGTTNPDFKLTVDNGIGNEGLKVIAGNNGDANESVLEAWNHKINGSSPELLFKVRGDGNVGIGTSSPNAKLHIEVESGSIDSGNDRSGAVLRLAHNAEWNSSYDDGGSNPDFLGGIEFETSDASGGTGVRTAIKTTVDHYANLNSLAFYTAPASNSPIEERLRIDSAGNVGIGTTSPGAKLLVLNEIENTYSNNVPNVSNCVLGIANKPSNEAINNHASLQFNLNAGTHNNVASISLVSESATLRRGALTFCTEGGASSRPEAMRIDSAGNVGIGTSSPNAKLHIRSNSLGNTGIAIENTNNAQNLDIDFYGNSGTNSNGIAFVGAVQGRIRYQEGSGDFEINPNVASDAPFKILYNGNVGIGTPLPDVKLEVNGGDDDSEVFRGRSDGGNGNNARFSLKAFADGDDTYGGGLKIQTRDNVNVFHDRLTIKQDGNVGIGTTSPDYKLDISTNSTTGLRLINPDSSGTNVSNDPPAILFQGEGWDTNAGSRAYSARIRVNSNYSGAADRGNTHPVMNFELETNENDPDDTLSTKMVINADGNVGIGTTSPSAKLEIEKNSYGTLNAGQGHIVLDTIGVAREKDKGPFINFRVPTTNTTSEDMANIGAVCSDSTASSRKADLVFWTRDITFSERMRITSDGNVGIGTATPGSYKLNVNGDVSASSYTPTSDDRVKHNEQPIVGALETLSKVTPKKYIKTTEMYDTDHDFELDADGNPVDENGEPVEHRVEAGVIAQQVLSVDELAFAVSPEGVDEDGMVTSPHGLDYNSLFTYAIAAIQEQQTIINDLKSRIETLEK